MCGTWGQWKETDLEAVLASPVASKVEGAHIVEQAHDASRLGKNQRGNEQRQQLISTAAALALPAKPGKQARFKWKG